MNPPLYNITSIAKGPDGQTLFLDADNFGNVRVEYSGSQATSQWLLCYDPDTKAVMIMNAASGWVLTATGGEGSNVVTISWQPGDPITSSNSWTFRGDLPSWTAIRPLSDGDLNLNIRGNTYPAETEVILWRWNEKHPEANSEWAFSEVSATQALGA